ncbi:MAG: Sensory/regulatory protein RpfC [Stenotrophomonas maltophilia]|nr:MAG: Sensory/regulatory protein RpfC [Stenotrophomonas maltophilia]
MLTLQSFFLDASQPPLLVFGDYNLGLVLFSVLVATLASGMALQVAGLARESRRGAHRRVAVFSGGVALGGGVWAMHFIGMLAFSLCAKVNYSPLITLLSTVPSLAASWVALRLLSKDSPSWRELIIGGVLVGAGIGTMHYTGMAAMQMAPLLRYDPLWFGISILVAVVLAILALWVRFALARSTHLSSLSCNLIAGLVMGLAISGMHYTGMAAARFVGIPESSEPMANHSLLTALIIGATTLGLGVLVAAFNGMLRFRHMNQKLQTSELHLRSLFDTAVDGILTIDHRGRIRSMNRAVGLLFGWAEENIVGQPMEVLLVEKHTGWFRHHLERFLATGQTQLVGRELEVTARCADGSVVPARVSLGLMRDSNDRPLFVAFVADISQRKAMENALQASEQQYRSLIRNIPGVSFRCQLDMNWTMLFVSEAVESITGYSPEDYTSGDVSIASHYHPDDREGVYEQVHRALEEGRKYVIEYRLIDRHGGEHWVWESGSAVRDELGHSKWIDGVMLDVTETKLRNAEYEGKVRAISRVMGVIEFDLHGRILAINENMQLLTGYTEEELIGCPHSVFCDPEYVASEDYERFWTRLRQGEYHSGEYHRLGKDGRELWIQASYNPIFDADGRPFKVVKFATDLSERREMEKQLREAKTRAEQAAASKTTFLANMSHEIRTPMNAVIGFADLLMSTQLNPVQRRHLGTVRQSARSLLGLLNDILDTAKLERGLFELEVADLPLRQTLEQVLDSLRLGAEAKGLSLDLDYHPALSEYFRGDSLRIRQIVTNLVGNAVKFTERGYVRVVAMPERGDVHLLIRDTGIGIPADRLEGIFDPFSQADASMSRRFGGTGLGTTIARQLVELMGGRIWVESEVDVGSFFHVILPLEPCEAPQQDAVAPVRNRVPELRVLIADDVPQNLELLGLTLQAHGHSVVAAADGDEVVRAFERERFDVILMDVQMPGTDGLEATRIIRRLERERSLKPTPIIAVSASVLDEDRRIARETGMDGFATKPLEINCLLDEIARVVTGRKPVIEAPAQPVQTRTMLIDWAAGARLWGDEVALAVAARRFLAEQSNLVARLRRLCLEHDCKALGEVAHRTRGVAGNLSMTGLYELLGKVEACARAQEAGEAAGLLDSIDESLERIRQELDRVTDEVEEVEATAPLDLDVLQAMVVQLRHGELDTGLLEQVEAQLRGSALGERLKPFSQAVSDFEFERAADCLDEAIAEAQALRIKEETA